MPVEQLFRYYKGHEKKGPWKHVSVEKEEKPLAAAHIGFATVLSLTEAVQPGKSVSDNVKYQGPFYVDVDSDSIQKSIKTAKNILAAFNKNGVPDEAIMIWASGKRGFHFTVEMSYFTTERPMTNLPMIYKQMMLALKLNKWKETDVTVYSMQKGRMWRIENKERADNKKFKVPVTAKELREMTEESYDKIVSTPRTIERKEYKGKLSMLDGLFRLCVGKAAEAMALRSVKFVDPEIKALLTEEDMVLPPCGSLLLKGESIKTEKGFNDISMQFAKVVAAFSPEQSRDLVAEFATNAPADSYDSEKKRRDHTMTALRLGMGNNSYGWSCRSMLSVLSEEPCIDCPVASLRFQDEEGYFDDVEDEDKPVPAKPLPTKVKTTTEPKSRDLEEAAQALADAEVPEASEEPAAQKKDKKKKHTENKPEIDPEYEEDFNAEGLISTDKGYAFPDTQGLRLISNFTLKITKYYMEFVANLGEERRTAVTAKVMIGAACVGSIMIEEDNWKSKANFINCFNGLSNAGFYGRDDDVQKMRIALMNNIEKTAQRIVKVNSAGIHHRSVAGTDVFTYVEPNWSLDNLGNQNMYYLSDRVLAAPELQHVPDEFDKSEMQVILQKMMRFNAPQVMAQMFSWVMAGFLKTHILTFRKEFPLLGLHGNRGSGKSKGIELMCALHGLSYVSEESTVNLPSATPFVVWNTISTFNSAPVIMDEYNKSKMKRTYDAFGEVFKDVWQAGAVKRGTLSRNTGAGSSKSGAHIVDFPLLAPLAILSEQGVTMPALVQRTVQVGMRPADLKIEGVRENYDYLRRRYKQLKPFAKACYMQAISLPVAQVQEWIDKYSSQVSLDLGDRPHYSFCVLLAGLEFFDYVCHNIGIDMQEDTQYLRDTLLQHLSSEHREISDTKNRSELDIIMEKISAMAAMDEHEMGGMALKAESHYLVKGESLYLDGILCFMYYLRYCKNVEGIEPPVSDYHSFKSLMKNESYCESVNAIIPEFKNKMLMQLSLSGLASKGIETDSFKTTDFD